MKYLITTEDDTKEFARKFASNLKASDVVTFHGDLGAGKTFIAREIIRYFCGNDTIVQSPTFNLLQTYELDDYSIYHYDLYRLKSIDEIYELGIEEAFSGNICLIEWPDIIKDILPNYRIEVHITLNGNDRIIHIR